MCEECEIKTIHNGEELLNLKRKPCKDILKTIREQESLPGRQMKRKEEYLTRHLKERKYLQSKSEWIIFDQYPLWKGTIRGKGPKKVDIIYAYKHNVVWSLGIVEAKVEGGESLSGAIKQVCDYMAIMEKNLLGDRVKSFQYIVDEVAREYKIKFPENCGITRIDILAPRKWWGEQQREKEQILRMRKSKIRPLCVPDGYLNLKYIPIELLI